MSWLDVVGSLALHEQDGAVEAARSCRRLAHGAIAPLQPIQVKTPTIDTIVATRQARAQEFAPTVGFEPIEIGAQRIVLEEPVRNVRYVLDAESGEIRESEG